MGGPVEVAPYSAGPWLVYASDPVIIVNQDGSSLGEMTAGDPYISYSTMVANAHVAAAGPEMLELLVKLAEIIPHRTLDPSAPLYLAMKAVIAKALSQRQNP